jgi:hypothetical protein
LQSVDPRILFASLKIRVTRVPPATGFSLIAADIQPGPASSGSITALTAFAPSPQEANSPSRIRTDIARAHFEDLVINISSLLKNQLNTLSFSPKKFSKNHAVKNGLDLTHTKSESIIATAGGKTCLDYIHVTTQQAWCY